MKIRPAGAEMFHANRWTQMGELVARDWTDVPSQPWHRSAAASVHCTKSYIYGENVLLRMGDFVARNM